MPSPQGGEFHGWHIAMTRAWDAFAAGVQDSLDVLHVRLGELRRNYEAAVVAEWQWYHDHVSDIARQHLEGAEEYLAEAPAEHRPLAPYVPAPYPGAPDAPAATTSPPGPIQAGPPPAGGEMTP